MSEWRWHKSPEAIRRQRALNLLARRFPGVPLSDLRVTERQLRETRGCGDLLVAECRAVLQEAGNDLLPDDFDPDACQHLTRWGAPCANAVVANGRCWQHQRKEQP